MTPPSHQQWVRWGDVAADVKDWAITGLAIIGTAVVLAPLCFTTFLLLLHKIGNL